MVTTRQVKQQEKVIEQKKKKMGQKMKPIYKARN